MSSFNLLTVVGNRPQFIKMAPLSAEIRQRGYREFIVHTGQHHDDNMSQVFFDELNLPRPDINLEIGGGTHGQMTATMLAALEPLFIEKKPQGVLVYGDTNSTLAATLAAVKLHIPIVHVEAGPRIYDIDSPEEVNRLVADHSARLRFCPDLVSVQNLAKESITQGVHFSGDVMYDAFLTFSKVAATRSSVLESTGLKPGEPFALLTAHRPNNTDTAEALNRLVLLLKESPIPVVFPVHPRTEAALKKYDLWDTLARYDHIKRLPAVGYLDILNLLNHASVVLTDSGGLQKEGFFAGKPVFVLFYTTPWPQIEACGWQRLSWDGQGIDVPTLLREMTSFTPPDKRPDLFGDGRAAAHIVDVLEQQSWWQVRTPEACQVSNA
jgi:UDP-N-acetylglucosamine 2-epimerase (non-hydrolysing)/UDP-GlcNAc3NAcA epimerase